MDCVEAQKRGKKPLATLETPGATMTSFFFQQTFSYGSTDRMDEEEEDTQKRVPVAITFTGGGLMAGYLFTTKE